MPAGKESVSDKGSRGSGTARAGAAYPEEEVRGLTMVGRSHDVGVAAPPGKPLSQAPARAARRRAEACPPGALSTGTERACQSR